MYINKEVIFEFVVDSEWIDYEIWIKFRYKIINLVIKEDNI
jgi:hypothetical protein